jgi:phage repressor protein C with HTH and peptisase S24 domain
MEHAQIWRAIDALAAARGLTPSGLARIAGLDPTTFNRSKRHAPDGRPRWPSTESLACALEALETDFDEFAALMAGGGAGGGRAIPIVGMARAGAAGFFDDQGFPVQAEETCRFPGLGEERIYALEIAGDSMEPVFRDGDVVIVAPGAVLRRGDRVVVRTREGEVLAKALGRRNDQSVELISFNPAYAPRAVPVREIDWIARIMWASQ